MDRITNESNLWLQALKLEDEGNYIEAFKVYLKDSKLSLQQKSFSSAALSCSCAANCIANTGNPMAARKLYHQAGKIYENNGDHVIGNSVREALWSYQEAYDYFTLACENFYAQNVCEKFVSLSKKVNPFFGEKEALDSLMMRKLELDSNPPSKIIMQVSADIDAEISDFLNEIKTNLNDMVSDNEDPNVTKSGGKSFEKSIAN